jgi:positive regulator of sigma E activity
MLLLALTLFLLAVALFVAAVTTGNAVVISVSIVLVCLGVLVFVTHARPLFKRRDSALVTAATPDQNDSVRWAATRPSMELDSRWRRKTGV